MRLSLNWVLFYAAFALGCLSPRFAVAFFSSQTQYGWRAESSTGMSMSANSNEGHRRALIFSSIGAAALLLESPTVSVADTGAEVRGTPVNAFNGLAFQYRGSDFNGLEGSDIDEPSISYADFMTKLKSGGVTFVEFMAPDGDKAYATLADNSSKGPIRIGEGYPIEQHDGYSSPAFAIRAVKNAGVPYKFTVPNLKKYTSSSPPKLLKY